MRTGSDYWRPGKLLTETANLLREKLPAVNVFYAREDLFCPPESLLREFRETQISFGEYGERYAQYLRAHGAPELASAHLLTELARGNLSVFYCVDPFIPSYCKREEILHVPYQQRTWIESLRFEGCHRVVLAEEIMRFLIRKGLSVELYELDPTFELIHAKSYSQDFSDEG
jgi:hypothetical protein